MKRHLLFFVLFISPIFQFTVNGQQGIIVTIAGGGSSTAEGMLADSTQIITPYGICTDSIGNIYYADGVRKKVRRIDKITNRVYTVAGTGTTGYSGDGGLAINAEFDILDNIRIGRNGNLYIGDYLNKRIRMVTATTGIITTVAGAGLYSAGGPGSDSEGIPAIRATIECDAFTIDGQDNIYVSTYNKIRKIDASTGIINTIAGAGGHVDDGDGALALAANISGPPRDMQVDKNGNLYFLSAGNLLRRIDASTGIINTVAGEGTSRADTCWAYDYKFGDCRSFTIDRAGNLLLLDSGKIKKIDVATQKMMIIAGGGSSFDDSVQAITANLTHANHIYIDKNGNVYLNDFLSTSGYRKIIGAPAIKADSFSLYIDKLCQGPTISVLTKSYSTGMYLKTWFGDKQVSVDTVRQMGIEGALTLSHNYVVAGQYSIKHVLYRGITRLDSISYPYEYLYCNTLPVKLYYDVNSNCQQDAGESYLSHPSLIEVDSNSVAVATLATIGSFYYNAYGNPGDVYSFKILNLPSSLKITCPSTGVLNYTLKEPGGNKTSYIGIQCVTGTVRDMEVNAVIPVTGQYDQWGNIYVSNKECTPHDAIVTLHFSPKYTFTGIATPPASSIIGNSITWNLNNLSCSGANAKKIFFELLNPSTGPVPIREEIVSYVTVDPIVGDADTTNNTVEVIDTVRGSCDPNEIWVIPNGHILAGTELEYKIEFENVGNDTAHNIYVMDTLSDYLDVKSMNLVMASHNMNVGRYVDPVYHNIVRFDFPTINLLDSSYHDACTGTVIFKIKTKADLPFGTKIPNHAGIFFDANGVIMTNVVENIIGWPEDVPVVSTKEKVLSVYPNPAKNHLQLTVNGWQHGKDYLYSITDMLGRQVMQGVMTKATEQIDISSLLPGMYFTQVGNYTVKFVKE